MFSDLTLALEFDKRLPLNRFLLISKDHRSDFGFVHQDFLQLFLRHNKPVLLLNLSQSFSHYHYILSKVGLNLRHLRETGKIISIDGLNLASEFFELSDTINYAKGSDVLLPDKSGHQDASECQDTTVDNKCELESHPFSVLVKENSHGLKLLYNTINKNIDLLKQPSSEHPKNDQSIEFLLLVDEITILLNLGIPISEIIDFIHYCYTLCRKYGGCLVIGSHETSDTEDEENSQLLAYLSHKCHFRIQIKGLSTGYSKHVHGIVSLVKQDKGMVKEIGNLQFKLEEKGAKLFPLGTLSTSISHSHV